MAVNELETPSGSKKQSRGNSQVSFRGLFALTSSFALWIFLLADFRREPMAVVVFWSLATVTGVAGHLIHSYLLPWRGTVVIWLLVFPLVIFTGLSMLFASGEAVLDVLLLPIDLFRHQTWNDRLRSTIPMFVCVLGLVVAHPVKPSLVTAIVSAIGVSLWYGMAILIAANAG